MLLLAGTIRSAWCRRDVWCYLRHHICLHLFRLWSHIHSFQLTLHISTALSSSILSPVRVLFFIPNFIWVLHIYFQTPLISYWVFPNIFCSIIMLITNISYSLSKLGHDINYHKKPKNSYFIQFYYNYLAKPKTNPLNPMSTSYFI